MKTLNLLIEFCGPVWLVSIGFVGLVNLLIAAMLVVRSKSVVHIVAFLPVLLLPMWVGALGSLFAMLDALEIGSTGNRGESLQGSMMLGMACLPTLVGAVMCIPGYMTAAIGRFLIVIQGSTPSVKTSQFDKPVERGGPSDEDLFRDYAESITTHGYRK